MVLYAVNNFNRLEINRELDVSVSVSISVEKTGWEHKLQSSLDDINYARTNLGTTKLTSVLIEAVRYAGADARVVVSALESAMG